METEREVKDFKKYYFGFSVFAIALLGLNVYYFAHPMFDAMGFSHTIAKRFLLQLRDGGLFVRPLYTKLCVYALLAISLLTREGSAKKMRPWLIIFELTAGTTLFFLYWKSMSPTVYISTTTVGLLLASAGIADIGRGLTRFRPVINDINETFEQCEELIETEDSINIPTKYKYHQKEHRGWINVVNPFRATLILGTPGSGKSYSVYNPFIEQMIKKDYCMFVYDYKFPDLTEIVYNETLRKYPMIKNPEAGKSPEQPEWINDPKAPEFFIINFNNPRYTNRCNPIHARYIKDQADSAEIADIIMKNIAPGTVEKEDFFSMSAKVYIDAIIYYLSIYKGGIYCDFPHVVELISADYKKVFAILAGYPQLETKIKPFASALEGGAQEQLQGQIASAAIPMNKMASAALYWVLSGDDFSLDINNPEAPKIICIGNDPDRQTIYGTTLALYTSRIFKLINHKHKRKCGVLLDELPTIFIKGLDNLIATARSNKVAIALGAQDKSQLVRDYSQKEADVIFNAVGNIFAGQVNGKTAEDLNKSFGKEFREQQSQTLNTESDSISISFHQEELMPISKIETLTQGYFFGKVADNNKTPIERKLFCGEIQIDHEEQKRKSKSNRPLPKITSFGDKEIYEEVHKPYMKNEILRRNAIQSIINEGIIYPDDEMEIKIEAFIKALSEKETEDLLIIEAEALIEEKVWQAVEANYNKIRDDIKQILIDELGEEFDDEEEEDEEDESVGTADILDELMG